MSDSSTTLVGNLTRDPELRFAASGTAVLGLGLAVNKRKKEGDEYVDSVSFFNAVAFGTLAENAAASLQKGNRVIVTGELEQREYETKEGEKRNTVELTISSIGPDLRWATADVTRTESGGTSKTKTQSGAKPPRQQQLDEEPF